MKKILPTTLTVLALAAGCGSNDRDVLLDNDIQSIVFLQRAPRLDLGNVFQYSNYIPGARLVSLTPPSADGTLEVLCCDHIPEFADADINGYDLDFDATKIVMSAKLSSDQRYGLFIFDLTTREVEQLPTDPTRDYTQPIFLPNGRVLFMTNAVVEPGEPQFSDEYVRGTASQTGTINADGSDELLGARNLSHRVTPTLLSDGRVMFTQWDHLGSMNAGHLMIMNPDMTTVREAYGKEGSGVSNSYIKPVEIAPGRVVAISTSRTGTIQAGALLDIRLGEAYPCGGVSGDDVGTNDLCADKGMSEANSGYRILTPQVPRDRAPSFQTVGRYFDAFPVTRADLPYLLVSWADGPVHPGTLSQAGMTPDFGIYLFDAATTTRRPVFNDETMWDVMAKPLRPRDAPPVIPPSGKNGYSDDGVLLGSINVYDTTNQNLPAGEVYGVRVLEGFSGEVGPRKFGLTLHEGSALLGVAPVHPDGSWAAVIPPNAPVHLQAIDVFGMSFASEPIWISGAAGESRFCGGCHEDRAAVAVVQPGITAAVAAGPVDMNLPRPRTSFDYTRNQLIGVPWGDQADPGALQRIFDAKCISCHDGDPNKPGNKSITITDNETGDVQTFTFDLRSQPVVFETSEIMLSAYTASHLSLLGPGELQREINNAEADVTIEGDMPVYVEPNQARNSILIQMLNPPQLYPSYDASVRAFDGLIHPLDVGGQELTEDEYFAIILMADGGGQFYSRENAASDY